MSATIPITLNLTYDQIEAFSVLGFSEVKAQLGIFSHKIYEIRRALEHISIYRRYVTKYLEKDNASKFNVIYQQLKRLTDIPYDLIQKNETLYYPFLAALQAARGLVNYPQNYTDAWLKSEAIKEITTIEKLLYAYVKQYNEF